MERVIGFSEALAAVLAEAAHAPRLDTRRVALLDAVGCVLAEPILADRDQPPFDRATRDGFAVRAEEFAAGDALHVLGQLRAGEQWAAAPIGSGQAVEIMTGAPLPPGADAVAMVEHVVVANGAIRAQPARTLRPGENVVRQGEEATAGACVLNAGASIDAAAVALAAACGHAELTVFARPRVAIVATGDELIELSETPRAAQIRNSNSYALAALVQAAGGAAERLPIARDARGDLSQRLQAACAADLVLFSGGVSAGKYDLVEETLAAHGAEFLFTGVRMQPGRPVVFGRLPGVSQRAGGGEGPARWFFGLPGNPISTEVTFHCFVAPLLRALGGASATQPRWGSAALAEDVAAKDGLTRVLPAVLTHDLRQPERAGPQVRLVGWRGSGDLAANARANCYALLVEGRAYAAGETVTLLLR